MKNNLINILKSGGIAVVPTDTIYGIVGLASSKEAVSRIREIKMRGNGKSFIVLVSSVEQLGDFGVNITEEQAKFLRKIWPGKVSVEFPIIDEKWRYIHGGSKTIAFRLPKNKKIISVIKLVGPLVAPSANPEGLPPAVNIKEAKKYFDNKIDFYLSAGDLRSRPSTLIKFDHGEVVVLRQGEVKVI